MDSTSSSFGSSRGPIPKESPSPRAGTPLPPPPPPPPPPASPRPAWSGPHSGGCGSQCAPPRMYPPMGYPPGPPGQVPYGYPPPPQIQMGMGMGFQGRYPAYAQGPPGMYYPHPYPYRSGGNDCFRALVLFLLIIILGFFVVQYMSGDFFGPGEQIYRISSFSLSNFSISSSVLNCVWETKVEVESRSIDCRSYFKKFVVTINYKDVPVISSSGTSFLLDKLDRTVVDVQSEYNSDVQPQAPKSTVNAMKKERDSGWVTFSVKITMEANYYSTWFYTTSRVNVEAECFNLKVPVQNSSTSGTFNYEGEPIQCISLAGDER